MKTREQITYEPAFCNRGGTFQISQAYIGGKYVFTQWDFFPPTFQLDRNPSTQYRFICNAVPTSIAKRVFPGIETEELPYTEGFSFPVFKSDELAMEFLESDLFDRTFQQGETELPVQMESWKEETECRQFKLA